MKFFSITQPRIHSSIFVKFRRILVNYILLRTIEKCRIHSPNFPRVFKCPSCFITVYNTLLRLLYFKDLFTKRKVTLPSWLTPAGGQETAQVYNLAGQLNARLYSKGVETIRRVTLPGVITSEKVNPPARVTLARR